MATDWTTDMLQRNLHSPLIHDVNASLGHGIEILQKVGLLQSSEYPEVKALTLQQGSKSTLLDRHELSIGQKVRSVTITETQIVGSDVESESESDDANERSIPSLKHSRSVREIFERSKSQWIDDPVITQWRDPGHHIYKVVTEAETLHREWRDAKIGPFNPDTDKIWLQVGQVLADVGLPWHNNQINMPDEIDTSWPFHFKSFERQVMKEKGSLVGDPNPSGYVCNWGEANCYGIRALQQELREKCPDHRPILAYDRIELEIVRAAETLFGLEVNNIDLSRTTRELIETLVAATKGGIRPVIFAATLGNSSGQYDNLDAICEISKTLPTLLHVDASRNFDYIMNMPDGQRRSLGIEKLTMGMKNFGQQLRMPDGSILTGTIVAGGCNHTSPAPVVALKPAALGSTHTMVSYTRASDSTLAGSRDALAPLWVALQSSRLGRSGMRQVYHYCARMRKALVQTLRSRGVVAIAPKYTLDVLIEGCSTSQVQSLIDMGGRSTTSSCVLLTVQPSVRFDDLDSLVGVFSMSSQHQIDRAWLPQPQDFSHAFQVPHDVVDHLRTTIESWKLPTRFAAGYPFHMGSYSALGPIIGRFLDVKIPETWIQFQASEILKQRLKCFGLKSSPDRSQFKGVFTNGSTMGNRIGIHTALKQLPGAYLYFSADTHYSVAKTARDCDLLAGRWTDRPCRYSEISSKEDGSICVDHLTQQAHLDQTECQKRGEKYQMVLFLNCGTTFVGARDNLTEIRERLTQVGIEISYIHADGALDFGFDHCGIALGPPGVLELEGRLLVQGITLSHHKAMGNMVSGEVLCYSPGAELTALGSEVDPRAVFETWLYSRLYTDTDLAEMLRYCEKNASRLETRLQNIGVVTKRNHESTTVVMERPPAWITEEFSLRPQEDWVHFITMPHISPDVVDTFVDQIAWIDRECEAVFRNIAPQLSSAMARPLTLRRIQCRSKMAERVRILAQSLTSLPEHTHESIEAAIRTSLRGAMSVVAVDECGEPQLVFLLESTRQRSIRTGPVLVKSTSHASANILLDVMQNLTRLIAVRLRAKTETNNLSLAIFYIS